jgi:hypothetical protein
VFIAGQGAGTANFNFAFRVCFKRLVGQRYLVISPLALRQRLQGLSTEDRTIRTTCPHRPRAGGTMVWRLGTKCFVAGRGSCQTDSPPARGRWGLFLHAVFV